MKKGIKLTIVLIIATLFLMACQPLGDAVSTNKIINTTVASSILPFTDQPVLNSLGLEGLLNTKANEKSEPGQLDVTSPESKIETNNAQKTESPCGSTYVVRTGDRLRDIASKCEVSMDTILALNPFIDDPDLIYPGWVLDLSIDKENQIQIPETGAASISNALYVVKAGDSLTYIARRLDLSERDILSANPQIDEDTNLFTGQILFLPGSIDSPAAAVSPRVVEPGQMVEVVARGFDGNAEVYIAGGPLGETESILEVMNVNKDGNLREKIQLPMDAERGLRWTFVVRSTQNEDIQALTNILYVVDTTGPEESIVYSVRLNDTLSGIAVKFGIDLSEVIDANPQIEDPSVIHVGQDIIIPGPENR